MTSKLEKVANLAIVGTCIIFSTVLIRNQMTNSREQGEVAYAAGDRLPEISGLDLTQSEQTVLLVVSSTCSFCTESMPFYRKLVEKHDPALTRIITLTPDSIETGAEYFLHHGVEIDGILSFRPNHLRIRATPTVLLVSRTGEILTTIVGRVRPEIESKAMDELLLTS